MSSRKYEYYIVATMCGTDNYESYHEALGAFHREEDSATLYGVNSQGDVFVIRSK